MAFVNNFLGKGFYWPQKAACLIAAIFLLMPISGHAAENLPGDVVFSGATHSITLSPGTLAPGEAEVNLYTSDSQSPLTLPVTDNTVTVNGGFDHFGALDLELKSPSSGAVVATQTISVIPGWMSLLPPLLAIIAALLWKSVLPALFAGVWCGVWLISGATLSGLGSSFLASFQHYSTSVLEDQSRVSIIMFTMMLGGMIGILSKNGGMRGIVKLLTKFTNTPKRGQVMTGGMGCIIFFDDVANTLLIGKTMRPICDRLKISREKLAYIVDSTAAPLASVAFATTWIGYEVSLIESTLVKTPEIEMNAYAFFLNSIPYSFYSFLALFLVFCIAFSGRDFGPMLKAEVKARRSTSNHQANADEADTQGSDKASSAIIPIIILVGSLITGLMVTGSGDNFREIISSADSFKALMWASFLGAGSAAVITLIQRTLKLEQVIDAWVEGMQTTFVAMIVLILSWSLAEVAQSLHTSSFLIEFLNDKLSVALLPTLSFILAAIIALTTGTSWGTMGIMMPLILPLAWTMLSMDPSQSMEYNSILFASVASVLAGATWGDHCSPISDTTVLSSAASECDHIEHVRTQLPYAGLAGLASIIFCTLPVGFGVPWWICLLVATAFMICVVRFLGKKSDQQVA